MSPAMWPDLALNEFNANPATLCLRSTCAMPISCTVVPVTPYQQNCSIIKCEATGKAAIVDPGGDIDRILAAVEQMHATVEKIILTHAHMDHCAA